MNDGHAGLWIIEQLRGIPAKADAAVILRHAERGDVFPGEFGVDVPLTDCGVVSAERLGAMLSATRPDIRATASPVPRCASTAEAILRGGDRTEDVALDWRLGAPGPFVVDEEISQAKVWRWLGGDVLGRMWDETDQLTYDLQVRLH